MTVVFADVSMFEPGDFLEVAMTDKKAQLCVSVLALARAMDMLGSREIPALLDSLEEKGAQMWGITAEEFVKVARFARKHRMAVGDAHAALLAKENSGFVLTTTPQLYSGVTGLRIKGVNMGETE